MHYLQILQVQAPDWLFGMVKVHFVKVHFVKVHFVKSNKSNNDFKIGLIETIQQGFGQT